MNDNAKLWADDLENFEQTTGALRRDDKFCCLGVACELFHRETGEGEWTSVSGDDRLYFSVNDQTSVGTLPRAVQEWLGLSWHDGMHNGENEDNDLVHLNDGGKTFAEIAAVIRSEPEGLFRS